MSNDILLTVDKPVESMIVVRKSKFICNIFPVSSVEQAEQHLEVIRKKYWDATHNVYAYSIGLNDEIQKFSDDGEPSGTAGKPVLQVIKAKQVKNVLVVVTRYFGGILLGAGGLIRAYSDSACNGFDKSKIIKKVKCLEYDVTVDYTLLGKLENEIRQKKFLLKDIVYTDKVNIKVFVPEYLNFDFNSFILNLTSGNAVIDELGAKYVVWD